MARAPYVDKLCCIICGSIIPEDRMKKRAITCSPEHSKERTNMLRRQLDAKRCRYCMRPATPEEQARFRRWRAWEKKNPELAASYTAHEEETSDEDVARVD